MIEIVSGTSCLSVLIVKYKIKLDYLFKAQGSFAHSRQLKTWRKIKCQARPNNSTWHDAAVCVIVFYALPCCFFSARYFPFCRNHYCSVSFIYISIPINKYQNKTLCLPDITGQDLATEICMHEKLVITDTKSVSFWHYSSNSMFSVGGADPAPPSLLP